MILEGLKRTSDTKNKFGGHLPSDTKLLLTKNYSEIIIFEKLRISRVISGKSLSFPEILRVQIPSKITKNNSRGIIFAIISCQRVKPITITPGSRIFRVLVSAFSAFPRFPPFATPNARQGSFRESFCESGEGVRLPRERG